MTPNPVDGPNTFYSRASYRLRDWKARGNTAFTMGIVLGALLIAIGGFTYVSSRSTTTIETGNKTRTTDNKPENPSTIGENARPLPQPPAYPTKPAPAAPLPR